MQITAQKRQCKPLQGLFHHSSKITITLRDSLPLIHRSHLPWTVWSPATAVLEKTRTNAQPYPLPCCQIHYFIGRRSNNFFAYTIKLWFDHVALQSQSPLDMWLRCRHMKPCSCKKSLRRPLHSAPLLPASGLILSTRFHNGMTLCKTKLGGDLYPLLDLALTFFLSSTLRVSSVPGLPRAPLTVLLSCVVYQTDLNWLFVSRCLFDGVA